MIAILLAYFLILFKFVYGDEEIPSCTSPGAVEITVYYESKCQFSQLFLKEQLQPLINALGPNNVHLIMHPYGNAMVRYNDGSYEIRCQHGPSECEQNQVHSCALKYLGDIQGLRFIICLIKNMNNIAYCGSCMNANIINKIESCSKNCEGAMLHLFHGIDTANVNKEYVPYILINGKVFNVEKGLAQFKPAVCAAINRPLPGC